MAHGKARYHYDGDVGNWYRFAVVVLKPPATLMFRREWSGMEHVQVPGGIIIAVNHISYIDPVVVAHFLHDAGRPPRYLAKRSLFRLPLVGTVLRSAQQIPVDRYSTTAHHSIPDAVEAVNRGECVVVYPEGTITKDPAKWPMRAHTGVARIALDTGAPVIPMTQWGAQDVIDLDLVPHVLGRKTVRVHAGPPVDLSAFKDQPTTTPVLRAATDTIMAAIRDQVGIFRGETPPDEVFDPRTLRSKNGSKTGKGS